MDSQTSNAAARFATASDTVPAVTAVRDAAAAVSAVACTIQSKLARKEVSQSTD